VDEFAKPELGGETCEERPRKKVRAVPQREKQNQLDAWCHPSTLMKNTQL